MKNCKVKKLYTIIAPVMVLVTLLFSCPFSVHAATTVKKLPYDYTWNYVSPGEDVINAMLLRSSRFVDTSDPNLIVFWYELGPNDWYAFQYCVAIVDGITYPTSYDYDTTDLTTTAVTLSFSDCYVGFCNPQTQVWVDGNQNYAPQSFSFFGTNAVLVENPSITSGYRHMPLYGTVELDGDIIIGQGDLVPTPTDPTDPDPIVPDIPTPNIPDFPSDPTVENILEWVGNCILAILGWLVGFGAWLKLAFNKLITNIVNGFKNIFDNFKSLFKPYIDKVLEFINDFSTRFKDFVTDILSVVTDIKNALASVKKFFDYIIDLGTDSQGNFSFNTLFAALFIPSGADVNDFISNNDDYHLIATFQAVLNQIVSIKNTIYNLTPTPYFHVPSCIYHGKQIGNFDIDFSWYQQYKSLGDGIISAFLIIGYIYFLFFRAPGFIRGHSNLANFAISSIPTNKNGGDSDS